jgi:hypothetical protein
VPVCVLYMLYTAFMWTYNFGWEETSHNIPASETPYVLRRSLLIVRYAILGLYSPAASPLFNYISNANLTKKFTEQELSSTASSRTYFP